MALARPAVALSQEPGPVTPAEADAIRDTLTRPSPDQDFTLGDALALPFEVVVYPLRLVTYGVAEVAGWAGDPDVHGPALEVYRDVREAGFRPSVSTELGSRSGPSVRLGWVGLSPLRLESSVSVRGYQRHGVSAEAAPGDWRLEGAAGFLRFTEEPFWGVGLDRPEEARTDFLQDRWRADARVGWLFHPSWTLSVGGGWEETTVDRGRDESSPDLQERFDPGELPGLGRTEFAVARAGLDYDGQDVAHLWTDGLRGRIGGQAYRGLDPTTVDFGTVEGEVELALPFGRLRHLTLRAWARTLVGGEGEVPFTHLPALGGGETLRGYEWGRFRDRAVISGSAEWRFELWRDLRQRGRVHALVFGDYGSAAPGLDELSGGRGAVGVGLGGRWRSSVVEGWIAFSDDGTRVSGSVRTEPW